MKQFPSGAGVAAGLVLTVASVWPAAAQQAPPAAPAPVAALSMADAVRIALDRNQTIRAQRLTVDESKADEITAGLKPNLNLSLGAQQLSAFSSQFTLGTVTSNDEYIAALGYTFERGGKRQDRITVARDTTDVTAKGVTDAERQLRFQTEQAFINVLLAKSVLDLSRQDLSDYSQVVDINQQRVTAGDLAQGDFLPIEIQKLQFQTDVSAAEVSLAQARASLRQLVGFEAVTDDFDVTGELAFTAPPVVLADLKTAALASRPDLQAAESSTALAKDNATLQRAVRARDITGSVDYTKLVGDNTLGAGISFDLPFHDRNQGNIAHADIAIRQADETEAATRFLVLTDVTNAFAAYESSDEVVKLYDSGYLDQAKESLDITTYAFQRGAASLPDLLDAERTYRDTELAYRQALAALMTNARQINLVVGKSVIP